MRCLSLLFGLSLLLPGVGGGHRQTGGASALAPQDRGTAEYAECLRDFDKLVDILRRRDFDAYLNYIDFASYIERVKQQYPEVLWRRRIDEERALQAGRLDRLYSYLNSVSRDYYLSTHTGAYVSALPPLVLLLIPAAGYRVLEVKFDHVYIEVSFPERKSAPYEPRPSPQAAYSPTRLHVAHIKSVVLDLFDPNLSSKSDVRRRRYLVEDTVGPEMVQIKTLRETVDFYPEPYEVEAAYLGIIADEDFNASDPSAVGARVLSVEPGAAADKAGLSPGDLITAYNGKRVGDFDEFYALEASTMPGTEVTLGIVRSDNPLVIRAKLGKHMITNLAYFPHYEVPGDGALRGITVVELTPEVCERFLFPNAKGVGVVRISPKSPAARAGSFSGFLQVKDIIQAINGQPVNSLSDFETLAAHAKGETLLEGLAVGYTQRFSLTIVPGER